MKRKIDCAQIVLTCGADTRLLSACGPRIKNRGRLGQEVPRAGNADHEPSETTLIGFPDPRADKVIPAAGIGRAEYGEGGRIEAVGIDLAFDRIDLFAATDDKIHLPAGFIAPVEQPFSPGRGPQGVQNQMLPKESAVVIPDVLPSPHVSDEARVESVDLGPLQELPSSAAVVGRQDRKRTSDAHGLQVGFDRLTADVAFPVRARYSRPARRLS